jgi:hypothetical protein
MEEEIDNLLQLVQAVSASRTGGYEVDFDIKPNLAKARSGDGFFLVIEVTFHEPDMERESGEYWFFEDGTIMQVMG